MSYSISKCFKLSILIVGLSANIESIAFDKFDNAVCEAASDDSARITCFRELNLNPTCRNTPQTELNCYRQSASIIVSEQDKQDKAKQQENELAMQKRAQKDYSYRSRMSPSALLPYKQNAYPKAFAKFGTRMSEIEALRKTAAEMALDSGKCDFVDIVDLSFDKSTFDHLLFWVDCANKQRIYLDEGQIKSSAKVMTQEERSWKEADALASCQESIKANALIPSSVNMHSILGSRVVKSDITHNVLVEIDFDAKNGLGIEMPYTAECVFAPGNQGEMTIRNR